MISIKYGVSLAKVVGLTGIDLLTWPPIDLCPSDPHRTARDKGAAWASEQGRAAPGLRRRSAGVRAIGRVGGSGASRWGQGASPWARECTRGLFGGGMRACGCARRPRATAALFLATASNSRRRKGKRSMGKDFRGFSPRLTAPRQGCRFGGGSTTSDGGGGSWLCTKGDG